MLSQTLKEEIVNELCDEYEAEEEDAIQAVDKAIEKGLLPEDGDTEKLSEQVYNNLSLWEHV